MAKKGAKGKKRGAEGEEWGEQQGRGRGTEEGETQRGGGGSTEREYNSFEGE